ncbi:MAG: transaldolase family protein [Chloroflexota bacterium]
MKFFLDSAKLDEIRYAREMWSIDGITSNPRHIRASGKPFLQAIEDLAKEVEGTAMPVSVEVNPHHTTAEAMVAEGKRLYAIAPKNFIVKLPATEAGFKALSCLNGEGIRVNLTLVFSAMQALQAGRLGATFVSPFVGWKESNGEEIEHLVEDIVAIYDNFEFTNKYGEETQVLVSAVRNGRHIVEAAAAGADIVTVGFDVYKEAFTHPYTDMGLKRFAEAWDATPYE